MDSTQKAEMQGGPKLYPFTPTLFEKLINPHGQGALFMFILVNDSSASIPHAQIHGDDRGHAHWRRFGFVPNTNTGICRQWDRVTLIFMRVTHKRLLL